MVEFLSTLSLRRATLYGRVLEPALEFLSTLSLRRATPACPLPCQALLYFYPRSPCGARPRLGVLFRVVVVNFYPRSPCGERPLPAYHGWATSISIHALLAESDIFSPSVWMLPDVFLSTLSLRRATWAWCWPTITAKFLSTLSLRRATSSWTNTRTTR